MTLPEIFLQQPLAHRGLHDRASGVIENSATAFAKAIDAGYGIELDVQLSADARPMVFHDYDLRRLTPLGGAIQQTPSAKLSQTVLTDGQDVIEPLDAILGQIAGRVPVLIELKDQDGAMGPDVGVLEQAVAAVLAQYSGPAAVMSFNPHSVAKMAQLLPDVPRGIVTSAYDTQHWPLPRATLDYLREIPDYARVGACFISHEVGDLSRPRVAELKAQGARILCWTVRTQEQADAALRIADNITFEGFTPA